MKWRESVLHRGMSELGNEDWLTCFWCYVKIVEFFHTVQSGIARNVAEVTVSFVKLPMRGQV